MGYHVHSASTSFPIRCGKIFQTIFLKKSRERKQAQSKAFWNGDVMLKAICELNYIQIIFLINKTKCKLVQLNFDQRK